MRIEPFAVERWMDRWETRCALNLAETCVESLSIDGLLRLTATPPEALRDLLPLRMSYGPIAGSERLRKAIAALYRNRVAAQVLVTHGTVGANMLVYRTLIEAGDEVVSIVPTYQQHLAIAESLGAEVRPLQLRAAQGWLPDPDALRRLVTPRTRLIALTNPNNPTGALMPPALLEEIAAIARAADAWILADEVYRGTDQADPGTTASVADLYEKGISTAGVSKAFSLAGLRLGWIAAPEALLEAVMVQRDYDTIAVGVLDDHFATLALEHADRLLARARSITRANLALLADWIDAEDALCWQRPRSGTTALLAFQRPERSQAFCEALLAATGVLFTPGSAMGMEGHVRIGFGNPRAVLEVGLERTTRFLAERRHAGGRRRR